MHTSVVIPCRPNDIQGILSWTLNGYAQQQLSAGHNFDVLVGIDGETQALSETPLAIASKVHIFSRRGAGAVRNALINLAAPHTDILIFGNADCRPAPDMVQRHIDALGQHPEAMLVLGSAPYERLAQPSVFDAFISETPAVFFYPVMQPFKLHNFRSCWMLNLSMRMKDFRTCGGFYDEIRPVFYEDLALGHRLMGREARLWYDPAIRVLHRHPMSLEQYLEREEALGMMLPVFAKWCPDGFAALFGGETIEKLTVRHRQWLPSQGERQKRVLHLLRKWSSLPINILGNGPVRSLQLATLYELHVPLKQLAFRLGFLRGQDLVDDVHWESRKAQGLWRDFLG